MIPVARLTLENGEMTTDPDYPATPHSCQPENGAPAAKVLASRYMMEVRTDRQSRKCPRESFDEAVVSVEERFSEKSSEVHEAIRKEMVTGYGFAAKRRALSKNRQFCVLKGNSMDAILPELQITHDMSPFLRFQHNTEGRRMLIFATDKDLDALENAEYVFGDGNFKYNPDEFHNPGQLYTLHAVVNGEAQPVVTRSSQIFQRKFSVLCVLCCSVFRDVRCTGKMPGKCCVPRCNGNYDSGPRVHVPAFPKDELAGQRWIRAIPRDNLSVSKHSKVCERHFKPDDILREGSHVDEVTGRTVTAPLSQVRLRPDAVPTIFPSCPSYISKQETRREDPEAKRTRLDAASLQKALAQSVLTARNEEEADKIHCVQDLIVCVSSMHSKFWHAIETNGNLILLHITDDEAPSIKYSVVVKQDLTITLHVAKTAVRRLGCDLLVPVVADSKRVVLEFLDGVEQYDSGLNGSSEDSDNDARATIISLLEKLSQQEEKAPGMKLLIEQVNLHFVKKERRRYSVDFMVFCCLLFTVSAHAYRFLRSHGSLILPHPRTVRSVCSSFGMSPHNEQQDAAFLSYIAKKIGDLSEDQRHVTLMVDEIHIKPFFDYKGGKISGVAANSGQAANSAFVFVMHSLMNTFEEVVHIVPVHKPNAEFLHKWLREK
ncbi:hypothetical protein HPB48_010346 [Haemaphysalis longicornis]|uniref:THAP-type domain-containing protein n=1 Tax=Haemaphysalis longicornis TaxID=44386 RepID=A0A9J6H766_HAELO|nr:hypothetical protein HPB48_010346 [Haemaphysalis longicornis]